MKGQFIFEFLIAGIIFFVIVVYSINYMNMNVSDFNSKFHHSWLQNKAIQISEVLMTGTSSLSIADGNEFNRTRIDSFNTTYCPPFGDYRKLVKDLYLYETSKFERYNISGDVRIILSSESEVLLNCGPIRPSTPRADIERVGILEGEVVSLSIVVW